MILLFLLPTHTLEVLKVHEPGHISLKPVTVGVYILLFTAFNLLFTYMSSIKSVKQYLLGILLGITLPFITFIFTLSLYLPSFFQDEITNFIEINKYKVREESFVSQEPQPMGNPHYNWKTVGFISLEFTEEKPNYIGVGKNGNPVAYSLDKEDKSIDAIIDLSHICTQPSDLYFYYNFSDKGKRYEISESTLSEMANRKEELKENYSLNCSGEVPTITLPASDYFDEEKVIRNDIPHFE